MKAKAVFLAGHVPDKLLLVRATPPNRHAEIRNWPATKEGQKELALRLAAECRVAVRSA